ncbi:MAG: hypothetical protein KGL02_13980 [Acidobacteriota bacterium]|nr:hypothetical protein [Acidobacteriota bacterium]
MHTQFCGGIEIEDLLGHPAEVVEELRAGLAGGFTCDGPQTGGLAPRAIVADPKRAGFYEVQSGAFTYYIHVMPSSGKVLLLAAWPSPEK